MRSIALALVLVSGCAVVDATDGHLDDPDSCCLYYPRRAKVDACVREFLAADECARTRCAFEDSPHWVCYSPADEQRAADELGAP